MKNLIGIKKVKRNVKLFLVGIGIVSLALNIGCSKTDTKSSSQIKSTQTQSNTQSYTEEQTTKSLSEKEDKAIPQTKVKPQAKTPATEKTTVTYSSDIKTILDKNCVQCHNSFGSYAKVINNIKVGNPEKSELIKAVDGGKMSGRLSDPQIELLKKWVKQGAKK